jgi:hypothetical protein
MVKRSKDLWKLDHGIDQHILNDHNMPPIPVIHTNETNDSILVLETTNSSLLQVNITNDLTNRY